MFEVGFTELLLIFALALLVLGPQKLPKLAQQVGRWVGRARAMARQFRDQLEEEANTLETKMNVDPDIDTSMETKRAQATTPAAATPQDPAPPPAPAYQDVEEEFYPPDHHMHPANQAAADSPPGDIPASPDDGAAGEPSRQGELDLTNNPETPKAP